MKAAEAREALERFLLSGAAGHLRPDAATEIMRLADQYAESRAWAVYG